MNKNELDMAVSWYMNLPKNEQHYVEMLVASYTMAHEKRTIP